MATVRQPTVRTRLAVVAGRVASRASQLLGRGHGAVIGGRVAMKVDPGVLGRLVGGRPVTVVTGTNGKTTTTRLVAAGLGSTRRVSSNRGANLPAGLVEAAARPADELVFEVDELYVPAMVREARADVLVLLNLSRDQLDRITEIRRIADRWRELLAGPDRPRTVVANADDPLVVWAVGDHPDVRWVGAGSRWGEDAALCPECARVRVVAADGTWRCACGLGRPAAPWRVDTEGLHGPDGATTPMRLALPGDFNRANAAMAAVVCAARGVPVAGALAAMAAVTDVAGRYRTVPVDGRAVRLLMGKNPASWTEIMHLLDGGTSPVVVCLNARGADGMDPSWIWDVPFELLAHRTVVASGDRRLDLSVRLTVAGVDHTVAPDPVAAARTLPVGPVDLVATYTAFHDALEALDVPW
jgi:lipid II isoglutaminyl synthase (glutamine-hydrolysing)